MKIAFLGPANSIHTERWVNVLAQRGHKITLFSQHEPSATLSPSIALERPRFTGQLGYFLNARWLRQRLRLVQPDLLHAHYASGYGTTAALARFQPTLLSVWGSDVYDFPNESLWKRLLLRHNLHAATSIASTSQVMAGQVSKLVPGLPRADVTPFGVDCDLFSPRPERDQEWITIGTVKTLAWKYGIDTLLAAFSRLRGLAVDRLPAGLALRLTIVGGGEEREALEQMAVSLGIRSDVNFVGAVPHHDVPTWLNRFDVYVAASRLDSESFGVAAVEAGACGIPAIVSDAGGLPEVILSGRTGIVVPRDNVDALATALLSLVVDESLRRQMGQAARRHVMDTYEWSRCVDTMESVYSKVLRARR